MNLQSNTRKNWYTLPLAFLLPCAGMLLLRLISALGFDGEYSMLYSDCYHQYYPFFLEFRRALRSGESLLYSWNVGLGLDYLGLISYYLASPLNLVTVLLPENWMLDYFGLLMPLKLGFAGLFFAIFLKNTFRKNDLSIVLFGSFYALCAWALGYQWNIMWLDTFALLPLVVLGTVSLLKDKKFILYTLSLFLSIFVNYYIGFFVCIFVLLIFICYEICRWESIRKFFLDLLRIAFFSLLAIGMTAILELPALAALQTTQSSVNTFPTGFHLNITRDDTWKGLLDAMRQVAGNMNGGLEPSFKEGLPNLYCGIGTNIFALLFLTCRQVKLRDKICCVFLLVFFNVSFIIRQLDYIWHGFHFTNMIPYRFSFLYSFVMLYMAYRAWLLRRTFRPWQILTAGFLSIVLVLCSEELTPFTELITGKVSLLPWSSGANTAANIADISTRTVFAAYNFLFILVYLAVLLYTDRKKPDTRGWTVEDKQNWLDALYSKRRLCTIMLLAIMGTELVLNIANFGSWYPGTNVSNYPRGTIHAEAVIDHMHEKESENLFYRAETTHTQTLNDGALNNYNGITAFTSSANMRVTDFMKALGYGAKRSYNRYSFEESSPVANLFLNLKYMIHRNGEPAENAYFNTVYNSGSVYLLENNAWLPLGFMADSQLLNVDFSATGDRFLFQNDLIKAATGTSGDLWKLLSGNYLIISGSDLVLTSKTDYGFCSYEADTRGTITYRYTADRTGLFCFYLDQSKRNSFAVYINGSEKSLYNESYSLPQMLSVCDVQEGDIVEIVMTCTAGESGSINISAAILDEVAFRQCYHILRQSTLELTEFSTTDVSGTIYCNRDGVLYTSIPQNGNWEATVDGQPAQVVLIGDAMVGLLLSEGDHTVSFHYRNPAFELGWKISLVCLLIFIIVSLVCYHPRRAYTGKFHKV